MLSSTEYVSEATAATSGGERRAAAAWLERGAVGALFLLAFAAPHSIAATQTAWLLGMAFWVSRFALRPRPETHRTPVDYALLGFFVLTFFTALTSYDPDVSVGKLRAASLFTIVYLAAENVRSLRTARALALLLAASCALGTLYTFGLFAAGRGVRVDALAPDSPLRAAGVREGDTILRAAGERLREPEELLRAVEARGTVRVQLYRVEALPVVELRREHLNTGASGATAPGAEGSETTARTAAVRLGLNSWSRGRDERASGLYGHYTTYAEALQLVASLSLGLFVASRRKLGRAGLLAGLAFALMCGALLLTVTRASWLGLLVSALTIAAAGANRRTILVVAGLALPLAAVGLFVLQQKRRVGFLDAKEGSTAWRLMVYRESLDLLTSSPRHLLVGVGMDSIKRHYREWGLFDKGRQNWSHLHSTPLQVAVERGLPALCVWLALLFVYGRMLWRMARERARAHWVERGLVLGALGGLVGFAAGGLVHYNLGDSEVVMIFYFIMGLTLAVERLGRTDSAGAGREREAAA
ncbi:MAG TPA: O-antigen ligase family protein [Pyrinomonadaceae bacterium]|nr:O-antigen ligase family protein [Pyrinomonadaceae bacterium]